ncbi:PorT family protein [Echinicola marina]|uniref:PorT family protein n=1 Tax=Echinicola marina TaxID=2859768 RepID=UPI001CF6C58B|nr:PorT family protein [Echinicola marina]UCS93010.1 PorT family protein [Echinicola marina]
MKKDWPDMSDKELDDSFRKGLEEPQIPFVKEDWDKMQEKMSRLPNNGKAGGFFQSKWFLLGLGLALLVPFSWWGMGVLEGTHSGIKSNETMQESHQVTNGNTSDPAKSILETDQEIKLIGEEENVDQIDGNQESMANVGLIANRLSSEMDRLEFDGNGSNYPSSKRNREDLVPGSIRKRQPSFEQDKEVRLVFDREGYGAPPVKKEGSDIAQRWSFALLFSPDVSALKLKEVRGVGTSVGINLEYYFLPKWSLNFGGLYSFKTYGTSNGYQFSYPSSMPTTWVEGDCYVLDIPLNIRFYAINGPMDRWYASAGLSSYLMLKEKYQLINGYSSYYPNYENLEVNNKNQHFFQVLNLSMGYERRLSEKLSIQVEPYLKLPLNGVGEGQVSLKSAGALIGLKYKW